MEEGSFRRHKKEHRRREHKKVSRKRLKEKQKEEQNKEEEEEYNDEDKTNKMEKKKKKKKKKRRRDTQAEADNKAAEELKHRLNAVLEGLFAAEDAAKLQRRLRKLLSICNTSRSKITHAIELCFHAAVRCGDIEMVDLILSQRSCLVNVHSAPGDGAGSALHVACLLGDGAMAALLVKHGAWPHSWHCRHEKKVVVGGDEGGKPARPDGAFGELCGCSYRSASPSSPIRDANNDTCADLDLFELLAHHESEVARFEAEQRAAERERKQAAALAADRAEAAYRWSERLASELAFESRTSEFGHGWNDEATEHADASSNGGDWWESIARERAEARRREHTAFIEAEMKRRQVRERVTRFTPEPTAASPPYFSSFESNSKQSTPPSSPPPPMPSSSSARDLRSTTATMTGPDAALQRHADNEAWATFDAAHSSASSSSTAALADMPGNGTIRIQDIPWPIAGDSTPIPGFHALSLGDRKVIVRLLQRRWHPDKFTQRFGCRIATQERDAIMARINSISQALNAHSEEC